MADTPVRFLRSLGVELPTETANGQPLPDPEEPGITEDEAGQRFWDRSVELIFETIPKIDWERIQKDRETAVLRAKDALIHRLAAIEHEQWCFWTRGLVAKGAVKQETIDRWRHLWVPYADLPLSVQEEDRRWAQLVYDSLERGGLTVTITPPRR